MAIELQNVSKSFGEKQVLQNFSHVFPEGELTCVMGPSGCGKTTLLSLLLGLEQPDSGRVLGMEGRRKSAVFQEDRLCENAGAVSNLRLVNPTLTREEAEAMLRDLGLGDSLRQPVRTLSGGMKRRVAILRACAPPMTCSSATSPSRAWMRGQRAGPWSIFKNAPKAAPSSWSPTKKRGKFPKRPTSPLVNFFILRYDKKWWDASSGGFSRSFLLGRSGRPRTSKHLPQTLQST